MTPTLDQVDHQQQVDRLLHDAQMGEGDKG